MKESHEGFFNYTRNEVKNCLIAQPQKISQATELLRNYILTYNKIYTIRSDEKTEIWIYDNGIYIPQGQSHIRQTCRKILDKAYSNAIANRVIAKIAVDTYIDQNDFFKNEPPHLIPVQNGIFDFKKKELLPFSSEYYFFNKLPIIYDKSKDCPNIKKFFNEILSSEEDLEVVQELFGYVIYREYKIEKAIMFLGSGRNGKGKLCDLLKRFVGAENCANIPLQNFENDNFAMSELHNKLVNLSADISKTALTQTGNFKSLTGRDLISASRKFLSKIHFVNYAKMIFSANELPITNDITPAFFLRWVILNFSFQFVTKKDFTGDDITKLADPERIEKIISNDEMSGLFNFAVNGLERLLQKGDFSYSKSTSEVKKIWLRKSSSIQAFIMDCVEKKHDAITTKSEFRQSYNEYCNKHKITPISDKLIRETLATSCGITDGRKTVGEEQVVRCWIGILLKNEEKNDRIVSFDMVSHPMGEKGGNKIDTKNLSNLSNVSGKKSIVSTDKVFEKITLKNCEETYHKCQDCGKFPCHWQAPDGSYRCNDCSTDTATFVSEEVVE